MNVGISTVGLFLFVTFMLNPAFGILLVLLGLFGFGLFGWM